MANAWIASLRHCITNLTRTSGRDRRDQFWPYVGTVFAGVFLVWEVSFSVAISRLQKVIVTNPDAISVASGPGVFSAHFHVPSPPQVANMFNALLLVMAIIALITIFLLAAAAVRRLHDRGSSGWWGILPIPFLLFGFAGFGYFQSQMGGGGQPPMGLFMAMFFNNFIYIVCLVILIVMLASKSNPADNRYGPIATDS
ncbi:DUF805 domain-containing protein [Sphingomonas sp.]|uniref:DUF805 domain-containing protein n=1 Tax=Sphingomonas sp. TaxID=28214 RepID=UPI00286C3F59|nr:DUF805 domain-containing protein [Sphingomonas sp.]